MDIQNAPRARHKVVEIQRGINEQVVGFKDTVIDQTAAPALMETYNPFGTLLTEDIGGRTRTLPLMEAFVTQPDAANLLRDGIRFLSFTAMREMPKVWPMLARTEQSNKPQEEYLRDGTIGVIPRVPSGQPVPFIKSSFEGATTIKNHLYRMGVEITGDDIRFDRLGKIRQIAAEMGRAAMVTEDYNFFADITTTANYTRNSTTYDNDVGANQQTLTFNALSLDTACTIITTAKDRKSRQYLMYSPDTIIVSPKMEFPVKQFLMSNELARTHGNTTAEVRGMGTFNPYNGMFSRIIVSPWFGSSYEWAICDSSVFSYVWQVVDAWNILQEGMTETSEAWLLNNSLRYVIAGYFGHGFVDDRAWFYSDSSTAPTVS